MSCAEQCVTGCDKVCNTCSKFRMDASGSLARPEKRMNGEIVYTGRFARVGDHVYSWGVARRDAEELANLVSQMPDMPVVVYHPKGMFNALPKKEQKDRKIGRVDTAWMDEDGFGVARIVVEDIRVDNQIRRYARELSLGYRTDVIKGWDRNGRVDHLAFVGAARCGEECSIRLDSGAVRRGGGGDAFKVQSILRNKKNG